jgi:hypothetical protein
MADQKNFRVVVAPTNGTAQTFRIRAAYYDIRDNAYSFNNGPGTESVAVFPRSAVLAIIDEGVLV